MEKCINYQGFATDLNKTSYPTLIEEIVALLPEKAKWGYDPEDDRYQGVIYENNFMPILFDDEVIFIYNPAEEPEWDKIVTKVMNKINTISIKLYGVPASLDEDE